MNLTTKTQKQLASVEAHGNTCLFSLISFAECLNRAHKDFWNKPDDELQTFLQALLDDGNLETLFTDHEFYANTTNSMLQRYGFNAICTKGILKPFTIENGVIVITQPIIEPPAPEIIEPPMPDITEPQL